MASEPENKNAEPDPGQDAPQTEDVRSEFDPNSLMGTFVVAITLCIACSLVVSIAAVGLRPIQKQNQENKRKRNVLIAAGIWDEEQHSDRDIPELFESIETVAVNLPGRTDDDPIGGSVNNEINIETYNQRKAAKDPEKNILIETTDFKENEYEDIAGIKMREKISLVYLVKDPAGQIKTIVLPIYGKGLWSTLYGYLALEADTKTIRGITFYEHGETPGLGGEIENKKWKASWTGKLACDESGTPIIQVTKPGNAEDNHQIDGLSGATITSVGVEKTIRYWLGSDGFGPYLERIRDQNVALAD